MNRKLLKKWAIGLGIVALFFLILNLGLNVWLKYRLPSFIKQNTDYKVNYKVLDIDLATGNILATGIKISSKNPKNKNVISIEGAVDTLTVSRLGIYDALFNKRISSSDLLLISPNLRVVLAKPVNDKTGRKSNPFLFKNIRVKNGNISILRHTGEQFVAVNNLMLDIQNLQLTEESVENRLPVAFDRYDIQGRNFYIRPSSIYAVSAEAITTKSGLMNVRNCQLRPMMTYERFVQLYPKKSGLYTFKAAEMNFKDIKISKKELSLSQVKFTRPDLKIYTTNAKKKPSGKEIQYVVKLEDAAMQDAKVQILKPDGRRLFSAGTLNVDFSKIYFDQETSGGNIPFTYEKFKITGRDILLASPKQDISVQSVAFDQRSGDLRNIHITGNRNNMNVQRARFTLAEWQLRNNKLKLAADQIIIYGANGTISGNSGKSVRPDYSGIEFPLTVRNFSVKNTNISYEKDAKPLMVKDLNLDIANITMDAGSVKSDFPFKTGSYRLAMNSLSYKPEFYTLNSGPVKLSNRAFQLSNFALKPTVTRSQFIKLIPAERDLYNLDAKEISMKGTWDLLSAGRFLSAESLTITGARADIFRSKIPKDDPSVKPLYSELLRKIKFPLYIGTLALNNATLVYEEDTKASDGPGKLVFGGMNLRALNVNSGKMDGKPTAVPITIQCRFMNASPMNVNWRFDTASMSDAFTISGTVSALPASRINPFTEPYLKVHATGEIQSLKFNFKGNRNGLGGNLNMKHRDLKVSLLNGDGEKKKVLSAIANMVVRTNSGKYPESVTVDNVRRDPSKSFFNLFWRGIQEGLAKTLIGKKIETTQKSIKNTTAVTKNTVSKTKETVKQVKTDIKEQAGAARDAKGKVKTVIKSIFNKKAEN